jgi:hypothetical protein
MTSTNVYLAFWRVMATTVSDNALDVENWPQFVSTIFGSHTAVSICVDTEPGTFSMFTVTVNSGVFDEIPVSSLKSSEVRLLRTRHDFLHVTSASEEHDRILRTCRACVQSKLRYNYHDVLLFNVPFRTPMDKGLFEVETLHDAQAAILILRECLSPQNPVLGVVQALHSRTTMCYQLYDALAPLFPSGTVVHGGPRPAVVAH